ncbi:G5 domain-containing protein [Candidatus Saccharibacteria bacterium]|nr:G5 domain-containing protein [Candidatus Saccharibacteria bacterium]
MTLTNGIETKRTFVSEEITIEPVDQVIAHGTHVAPKPQCDPNYSGACVPIASDVDCGGGSGNGPAYLYGTATVVGVDIYGLDRDGDGLACE